MTTDHPVEKLGTKVMNSLDWTVQAFVDARISTEALLQPVAVESIFKGFGCQGRLVPGGRVQTPLAKGTVQRGKRQGRVCDNTRQEGWRRSRQPPQPLWLPWLTTTWGTVLKEGVRLTKQSEQNLNTLLNGSTELDDVVRALNMLDVESQEGIIKAAVKPVVHSFMETGTFTDSQPCEEETDETNDQSDEEEELCPPLEETMAASWIAQIGEERISVIQRR